LLAQSQLSQRRQHSSNKQTEKVFKRIILLCWFLQCLAIIVVVVTAADEDTSQSPAKQRVIFFLARTKWTRILFSPGYKM
jgi:ABC-type phosphate transport system permease subunit